MHIPIPGYWAAIIWITWVVVTLFWQEVIQPRRDSKEWLKWDERETAKEAADPTYSRLNTWKRSIS